jgi:hypothetical protein
MGQQSSAIDEACHLHPGENNSGGLSPTLAPVAAGATGVELLMGLSAVKLGR